MRETRPSGSEGGLIPHPYSYQDAGAKGLALANAKFLGRRRPTTAFPPRRGALTFFRKQNRDMIYGHALNQIYA
jgi:hypothetical protein